jgi:hypothetical protein
VRLFDHRRQQRLTDALALATGVDKQHRHMATLLQLGYAFDPPRILVDELQVVLRPALCEAIGRCDQAERLHAEG